MNTTDLRLIEPAEANQRKRRQRGFTLIEMLVVLGIIAFIATMVGVSVGKSNAKAKRQRAITGVGLVARAVEQFELDCGALPERIEDLRRAPTKVAGWSGPYLNASHTKDPWGTPYILAIPGSDGRVYAVRSLGADRAPGGAGDGADVDSTD